MPAPSPPADTMDAGIPQECDFLGPNIGKCDATENYKGLWEVRCRTGKDDLPCAPPACALHAYTCSALVS